MSVVRFRPEPPGPTHNISWSELCNQLTKPWLSAYLSQPFLLAVPPWSRPISPHRTRCQAGLNQTTRKTKKNKGHLATKQEVGQLFPDAVNSFTPTAQLNKSALSAYASSHRYFAVQRIATPTWQELVSLALVGFRPEPSRFIKLPSVGFVFVRLC